MPPSRPVRLRLARIPQRPRRILTPRLESLEPYVLLSFMVTSTADSGPGSLAQAILDANANGGGTIDFDINGGGSQTINSAGLPEIGAPVTIDGTSQPGYSGSPLITLSADTSGAIGITVEPGGHGSAIEELNISGFAGGILLDGAARNTISGDVVSASQGNGILISGTGASANLVQGTTVEGNRGYGIVVFNGASNNTIGGTTAAAADVIAGNLYSGITLLDSGTSGNLVEGNLIGTNAGGTAAQGNRSDGIDVSGGASNNTIGGTALGAGNVIAGNGYDGIAIGGAGTSGNLIEGNRLGTNALATAAIPNGENGVNLFGGASSTTIGGTSAAARNIIAGNGYDGIVIHDSGTSAALVEGNFIGTDVTGVRALGNGGDGVEIFSGASAITVGGTTAAARNVISGNRDDGVTLRSNASGELVEGNDIGTDITGLIALPNARNGVELYFAATNNTIGGAASGAGNLMSGNGGPGVTLSDSGTSGNVVAGNLIGTSASGLTALPNASLGVYVLNGASGNTIGGTTSGAGNVIAGNGLNGVVVTDTGTSNNLIAGNLIGTDSTGLVALGNDGYGMVVFNGASNNTIGGTASRAGNIISGNLYSGMTVDGSGTSGNLIEGNRFGTNEAGTAVLANGEDDLIIGGGATKNTVGGTVSGAGNLISGSPYDGVAIGDAGTSGNLVEGNLVGTDATGTFALPNEEGITLYNGASGNTIGGTTAAAADVLSGNTDNGVALQGQGTSNNLVEGNFVGTDRTGRVALPNGGDGILDVSQASNNTIGGTTSGAGNTIAFNLGNGVAIGQNPTEDTTGVTVSENSIFANAQLGIDLIDDGVTPNTPGGPHVGPNQLQNFPVLTSASSNGSSTTVTGTLNSTPNTTFRIEFFANPTADPSGYGQGQQFLGAITVTTDGNGNASYKATLSAGVTAGKFVSATATDSSGDSSEFSRDVPVS